MRDAGQLQSNSSQGDFLCILVTVRNTAKASFQRDMFTYQSSRFTDVFVELVSQSLNHVALPKQNNKGTVPLMVRENGGLFGLEC